LAESIDHASAGGQTTVSISPDILLASADLAKPFLAETPATASANFLNPTIYVDPNYFQAVTSLNPHLYIQNGATTPINVGSGLGTFTRSSDLTANIDSPFPLDLVREGKSWQGKNFNNVASTMTFNATNLENALGQIYKTGTFTYEIWAKPVDTGLGQSLFIVNGTQSPDIWTYAEVGRQTQTCVRINGIPGDTKTVFVSGPGIPPGTTTEVQLDYFYIDENIFSTNGWKHIVLKCFQDGPDANKRTVELWVNGVKRIDRANRTFTEPAFAEITSSIAFGAIEGATPSAAGSGAVDGIPYLFYDEFAVYKEPLTTSQIIQHYELIGTLSPNAAVDLTPFIADATAGTHQFTVNSNAIPEIKEATAFADMANPTLIAGRSVTSAAAATTASANILNVFLILDNVIFADPMISSAEHAAAYHLSSLYSEYVQANHTPYRYVTFDGATPLSDFGTDNDYSVANTVLGGQIVNPDQGINGKSAKTAGVSYTSDGVILKESEWDDTWGTGQFNYHSSFWIQKAPEDNSTGLRVLWNLNGHLDNQHAILFHYQNKLHMQFNNGSGTHIDSVTANNIDIFDGERHLILIAFDHTNNNDNKVLLYVDSVLVLTTELGAYTGQTVNGTSFVGPNDEANNHPRLGVGCLITPFGVTALPVVPTNTIVYLDEIVWSKTAISQPQVTALYNAMPDKSNSDFVTIEMTASGQFVNPEVSGSVNAIYTSSLATSEYPEPVIVAVQNLSLAAASMEASADFGPATRSNNVDVQFDVMVASAIFNSAGVQITRTGGPFLATAKFVEEPPLGIVVNGFGTYQVLSPWVSYLRATEVEKLMVQRGVN